MCFYKDTQAVLAKNSLHQFFLQKVAQQQAKAEKPAERNFQVKQEEDLVDTPHKKLQISNNLFKDLVKLSGTESSPSREHSEPSTTPTNKSFPSTEKMGTKFEPEAEKTSTIERLPVTNQIESLLAMIEKNNEILKGYAATQDVMANQIKVLAQSAKEVDTEESPFERLNRISLKEKEAVRATTNPRYSDMLSLFTGGRTSFPYALRLSVELPNPVLREKNIRIAVQLVKTSDGSIVENHGGMLLQISLHTWEIPSKSIIRNKAGNKVLQGEDECELKNGQGSFDKLQIDEVTSKFINGYIGILVVAKRPCNFGTSLESLHQKRLIKIQDIQPLLVEKVVVKSKKKNVKA